MPQVVAADVFLRDAAGLRGALRPQRQPFGPLPLGLGLERTLLSGAAMIRLSSTPTVLAAAILALGACGGLPAGGPDAGPSRADGGLDLNDVSFLFPLPAAGEEDLLLRLDESHARGALLPKRLYASLPVLVEGLSRDALYGQLRVVSVRVDPCFPSAAPSVSRCLKQVRLVAQPLDSDTSDGGVGASTRDAAVHLFFALSDADFAALADGLWALKALAHGATDGQPLDVHPVMRAEGLAGPYAVALRELVSRLCGETNLTRVAFMSVASFGTAWRFGAFDVGAGGSMAAASIPRLDGQTAQQVQEFGTTEFRNGSLLPSAPNDELDQLLSESAMRLLDSRTLDKALDSALFVENPHSNSPQTVDCASCHVASRARHHAEAFHGLDTSMRPEAFVPPARFDVRRMDGAGDDPHALRSFGYFGRLSALSQRTINESAAIAEALSGR